MFFKDLLNVPHVVEQIGADDIVEGLAQTAAVRIPFNEIQVRVFVSGDLKHSGRKIHPDSTSGLESGQQIAVSAAQLQDAHARRNQKGVNFRQPFLVIPADVPPLLQVGRELGPELNAALSIADSGGVLLRCSG